MPAGKESDVAKEKITVSVAGIKANLLSADTEAVKRMANSIDASVQKKMKYVGAHPDTALLVVAMEQAENLRKNAELIHNQQEQIFALTSRLGAILDDSNEAAPIQEAENALMAENRRLNRRVDELSDEIDRLKNSSR